MFDKIDKYPLKIKIFVYFYKSMEHKKWRTWYKEKEDIKLLLYMLNMTIYCVTLANEKVKDIKEIKEFNI